MLGTFRDSEIDRREGSPRSWLIAARPDVSANAVCRRLGPEAVIEMPEVRGLRRLAAFGRACEELFGPGQDVESALAAGEVFLLQSRPITSTGAWA